MTQQTKCQSKNLIAPGFRCITFNNGSNNSATVSPKEVVDVATTDLVFDGDVLQRSAKILSSIQWFSKIWLK